MFLKSLFRVRNLKIWIDRITRHIFLRRRSLYPVDEIVFFAVRTVHDTIQPLADHCLRLEVNLILSGLLSGNPRSVHLRKDNGKDA
jgi:hypothetical protein